MWTQATTLNFIVLLGGKYSIELAFLENVHTHIFPAKNWVSQGFLSRVYFQLRGKTRRALRSDRLGPVSWSSWRHATPGRHVTDTRRRRRRQWETRNGGFGHDQWRGVATRNPCLDGYDVFGLMRRLLFFHSTLPRWNFVLSEDGTIFRGYFRTFHEFWNLKTKNLNFNREEVAKSLNRK